MQLRELLEQVGLQYDQKAGMQAAPQILLRTTSKEVLANLIPIGYTPNGSGGKGAGAVTPWIAVFDNDETTSARHGMYVVYLFAIAKQMVYLTLNQGVTDLGEQHGRPTARKLLAQEAQAIRNRFALEDTADLDTAIDLGARNDLSVDYQYGNVLSRGYDINALPSNQELEADLKRFIRLYAHAIEARSDARAEGHSQVTPSPTAPQRRQNRTTAEFRPKNDSEVRRYIRKSEQVTQRKHETLIREYGLYLQTRDFEVATNVHPRDMTATRDEVHWLIEAKTVGTDTIRAVRDALSQLRFYEYFEYNHSTNIPCLALFNEPIGNAFVTFLESQGIVVVWHYEGSWLGTTKAKQMHLCDIASGTTSEEVPVRVDIRHGTKASKARLGSKRGHKPKA